jgi:hypothetical protein
MIFGNRLCGRGRLYQPALYQGMTSVMPKRAEKQAGALAPAYQEEKGSRQHEGPCIG